jgi:hypothetical protein
MQTLDAQLKGKPHTGQAVQHFREVGGQFVPGGEVVQQMPLWQRMFPGAVGRRQRALTMGAPGLNTVPAPNESNFAVQSRYKANQKPGLQRILRGAAGVTLPQLAEIAYTMYEQGAGPREVAAQKLYSQLLQQASALDLTNAKPDILTGARDALKGLNWEQADAATREAHTAVLRQLIQRPDWKQ